MEFKKTDHVRIKTNIFILYLIGTIIISRTVASLYFTERTEVLRAISGLSFHHFHYGVLLLMLSVFFMIFFKENNLIVAVAGIGNGLVIDSFIPSLLLKTERISEISAYNRGAISTAIFLTAIVIIILLKEHSIIKKIIKKYQ